MEYRQRYKGRYLNAHSYELRENLGWSSQFSIEEDDGAGVTETLFFMGQVSPCKQAALYAAVMSGRLKVDSGFTAL